jgi:hypothetical protein
MDKKPNRTPGHIQVVCEPNGQHCLVAKTIDQNGNWQSKKIAVGMKHQDAIYFSAAPKMEDALKTVLLYLEETMDSPEAADLYRTIKEVLDYTRRDIGRSPPIPSVPTVGE